MRYDLEIMETGEQSVVRPEYTHLVNFKVKDFIEFDSILDTLKEQFGPTENSYLMLGNFSK